MSGLRLMAVHAHPDDESSKGAATTARYAAEGHDVLVVTLTGGERGDILNPAMDIPGVHQRIREVRREEMAEAARILGVQQTWLGFEDSGLPEGDPLPPLPEGCFADLPLDQTVPPLVALIREFRPHVVTIAAVDAAAEPGTLPGVGGEPWRVSKVYYNQQFSQARVRTLHTAMIDADIESPYHDWVKQIEERPDDSHRITTRVQAAEWFEVRDDALRAHRTQIDPEGQWFRVPIDVQRSIWPTEEFELARSSVESSFPEDDLFAGLRTT